MLHRSHWGNLAFALCLGVSAWAADARAGALGAVKGLRIAQEGARTLVTIAGTGTPTFTVFKLERPTRVVVDVANARLDPAADATQLASTWSVAAVSATPLSDDAQTSVRVVITLRRPGEYDVKARGNEILVTVTAFEAPPAQAQTPAASGPGDAAMRKQLEAARAEAGEARAEADRLRRQLEQQK